MQTGLELEMHLPLSGAETGRPQPPYHCLSFHPHKVPSPQFPLREPNWMTACLTRAVP